MRRRARVRQPFSPRQRCMCQAGTTTFPRVTTPCPFPQPHRPGMADGATGLRAARDDDEGAAVVLVRHEISDAVEVFVLTGPVCDGDVEALQTVLRRALSLNPRGIVVDVSDAGPFSAAALQVLSDVRRDAPGWPRPALILSGASPELAQQLDLP